MLHSASAPPQKAPPSMETQPACQIRAHSAAKLFFNPLQGQSLNPRIKANAHLHRSPRRTVPRPSLATNPLSRSQSTPPGQPHSRRHSRYLHWTHLLWSSTQSIWRRWQSSVMKIGSTQWGAICSCTTWGKPWSKARSTRVRNWRAACLVEYYAKALLVSTRTVAQYASCG